MHEHLPSLKPISSIELRAGPRISTDNYNRPRASSTMMAVDIQPIFATEASPEEDDDRTLCIIEG